MPPCLHMCSLDPWITLPLVYSFFRQCLSDSLPSPARLTTLHSVLLLFLVFIISCAILTINISISLTWHWCQRAPFANMLFSRYFNMEAWNSKHTFPNLCSSQLVIFTISKIHSSPHKVYPLLLVNSHSIYLSRSSQNHSSSLKPSLTK